MASEKYILTLQDADNPGRCFSCTLTDTVSVGRKDFNDIAIGNDVSLSRCHCTFSVMDGVIYITDSGSTNGTFLNGSSEPLQAGNRTPVRSGDTVKLGSYSYILSVSEDRPPLPIPEEAEPAAPLQRTCPNCGRPVSAKMKFCVYCGAKMPEEILPPKAAPAYCTECGAPLSPGALFCENCGAKVEQ